MFDAICPAVYQQLRKRTGLSQAELSDALGVHRNTVVRFESGNSHPSQAQMKTLLKRAKCSREEFVELICEQMSELIDKRVGIHEGQVGFVPVTAIMIAYTLLQMPVASSTAIGQELAEKIDTARMLAQVFDRFCAELMELNRKCREQMKRDDGESHTC